MKEMYDRKTLRKLQEVELEIFKIFIDICEQNNIEYFALYGTALGAVRHKGFIPWDDDIDVGMRRTEYNRFLKIAEEKLPKGYKIINSEVCDNYPLMTSRVIKCDTEFRDLSLKGIDCEFGIFLDVFAFDNITDEKKAREHQIKTTWLLGKFHILRHIKYPTVGATGIKRSIIHAVCYMVHLFLKVFTSKKFFYNKCNNVSEKYNNIETKEIGYLCDTNPYIGILKLEDMYPLVKYEFEGIKINMPRKIKKILEMQYGDYMQIPPEDKRCAHLPYVLKFGDEDNEQIS